MKYTQKALLALVALLSVAQASADNCCGQCKPTTCFVPRSTGANTVREAVGWQDLINRCDRDSFYGAFAIAAEYSQSFRSHRIAQCLFGDDVSCNDCCGSVLNISGSCVQNRNKCKDWLADYFCLPRDFQSQITFCPRIRNFTADLQFYFGLDEWAEGLYFRLNLPITHTRWELGCCENICNDGVAPHDAGYFCCDEIPRSDLNNSALEFFCGNSCPKTLCEGDDAVTVQPLCCNRWHCDPCCPLTETRLADLEAVLGWNFVCEEDHYFGVSLRFVAPTGNKKCCGLLFEPVVGNGGHFQFGGGLHGHTVLWSNDEDDSNFSFYFDANLTHVFSACQDRCFDLCCKPNSRYALAQKLGENAGNVLGGGGSNCGSLGDITVSNSQFAKEFAPVANITNSCVEVSAAIEADILFKFAYAAASGFRWDVGYNFYARSCEKICRNGNSCGPDPLDGNTWALKGDAHVFGFVCNNTDNPCVALAATQSGATIHAGTNQNADCTTANAVTCQNLTVDNAQCAVSSNAALCCQMDSDQTNVRTSIQPVGISCNDLDLQGSRQLTHKLFTHFSYTWVDNEDWTPFLGVGASVEFAQTDCCDCCDTSCNSSCCPTNSCCTTNNSCGSCCRSGCCGTSCNNNCCGSSCNSNCNSSCNNCCDNCCCAKCGLNQWAVWIKGGVAFD